MYTNLLEEYGEHIRPFLAKLQEVGLYLKQLKWNVWMQWYIITFIAIPKGIKIEQHKICINAKWPEPICNSNI
jgi:hypothetical protein